MPGSTFKVLTTGDRPRRRRASTSTASSPTRREFLPPQTNDPIQNYGGTVVRRRPRRGLPPQLQHPVRPDRARRSGRSGWSTAPQRWGVGEQSRSTCPAPAASTFGDVDDFDRQPAAAGDPRLRPEQRPDGAAAHGDGRRHRRQRRRDDEAVRRRRRRSTTTATCSSRTQPEVWKTADQPADCRHPERR